MSNLALYGGAKPTKIIGGDAFRNHNPEQAWDDQQVGVELAADLIREVDVAVERLKAEIGQEITRYGAYQVRDAVADYISNSFLDVAIVDGKLMVCLDASNQEAQFRACWDLGFLLRRAGSEAVNANDGIFHNALAELHNDIPAPAGGFAVAQSASRGTVGAVQPPQPKTGRRVVTSRIARSSTGS